MLAERLCQLRKEQHLTQKQVAAAIGVTWRGYQNLEATTLPQYATLLNLADFFHVSADYLMGRTDKREVNR